MSQSPTDIADANQVFQYRRAWSSIYSLLENGHSLSGRERNCAFLNTGDGRFADVSSACGLDQIDDSRAIAIVDWDFDGQQDLWVTNRNAPWLRFFRNRTATEHNWLKIKLKGDGIRSNRDAIGARVVVLVGGHNPRQLMRTLRAGEGFLAQSSKWLHFGLAEDDELKRIEVYWPGGKRETFEQLVANNHYVVTQGAGSASRWNPPKPQIDWQHAPAQLPESSQRARVYLASRVPLPEVPYEDFAGESAPLKIEGGRPQLINLWASWCSPCLAELKDWAQRESEFSRNNLNVVALSVDGLGEDGTGTRKLAKSAISAIGFPYKAGMANGKLVSIIQATLQALIDKPPRLSVPSSILLDRHGQISTIYIGAIDARQLLEDVAALDEDRLTRYRRAAHFPGKWVLGPKLPDNSAIVRGLIGAGQLQSAEQYLTRHGSSDPNLASSNSEAYFAIASRMRAQGKNEESIPLYRKAVALNPTQARMNTDLGIVLMTIGRFDEAAEYLRVAWNQDPLDVDTRKRLVVALCLGSRPALGLPHAQALVDGDSNDAFARLFLAKALRASGKMESAVSQYRTAFVLALPKDADMDQAIGRVRQLVETDPSDQFARLFYAKALQSRDRIGEAVVEYQKALSLRPGWVTAQNDLAWLLATASDATVRDGQKAVQLASSACERTESQSASILDTLAAAQAEIGDFGAAVKSIDLAITLATKQDASQLLRELKTRRRMYVAKQPYRTPQARAHRDMESRQ